MSTKHKRVSLFYQNINREGKQFYSIATCSASPVAVAGKERKKEGERERERERYPSSYFHTLHVGWSLSWAASM
jgi:hypothetical protein